MNRRDLFKTAAAVLGASLLASVTNVEAFDARFGGVDKTPALEAKTLDAVGSSKTPQYFILIYVDGLWPGYIDKVKPPNIMSLIQRGTYFPNASVGHLTSNTIVSHAVGNAGLFPARWGIVDYGWRNLYEDAELSKIVPYGKAVNPGDYNLIVNYRLPDHIMRHYEYIIPNLPSWVNSVFGIDALTAGVSTKQYMATYLAGMDMKIMGRAEADGYVRPFYKLGPAEGLINDVAIKRGEILAKADEWVAEVATRIIKGLKPRYMLINLPDVDLNAHVNGGPNNLAEMYDPIMRADKAVGAIVNALAEAGILDKTVIAITADHGFCSGDVFLPPGEVKAALEAKGYKVDLAKGGEGYMSIWLSDPLYKDNDAKRKAARIVKDMIPQAYSVAYRADFRVGGSDMHIYVPVKDDGRPEVSSLLKTMEAPQGPDIVVFMDDEVDSYDPESKYIAGHGSAGWRLQNIPLILAGPGVPRGLVVNTAPYSMPRLVDIAPTFIQLSGLNVEYAKSMDGQPIFKQPSDLAL